MQGATNTRIVSFLQIAWRRSGEPESGLAGAQVLVSNGRQFVGSTPTSPFAQLALAQRTLSVVNGMQARTLRC